MRSALFGLIGGFVLLACSSESAEPGEEGAPPDSIDAVIPEAGKADSPFSACEVDGALLFVNDPALGESELRKKGVHSQAARKIVAARPDGGFKTIEELDAVPYVGPATLGRLAEPARSHCESGAYPKADVIFSPQTTRATSHLARAEELIDGAKRSIDIALYSFGDSGIMEALGRAKERGVEIRFIYEPARDEAKNPAGTTSAAIESRGVDVRFVNKIMHHKFMIVDGPREDRLAALDATLMSGSGNWSNSAATRYDENTVVLEGVPELVIDYQREFNLLWENSRDFVLGTAFERASSLPISDWMRLDREPEEVLFTSANFDVFQSALGPGFSVVSGRNTIADAMVEMIQNAKSSIWIASGHLRSRPVVEALLARHAEDPELDIRIYVDGQEYVSASTNSIEKKELEECVVAAGASESKKQACYDKDFHWSYPVQAAGIALRFKHYAYRWHFSYSPQMHHKYMLIDGKLLASGSYNLSDNAEHATMENLVVYRGGPYTATIGQFAENFEKIWVTGEAEGKLEKLLAEIENGTGAVPIVYDPMALDHAQVTELKAAIRAACPDVDSQDFREHPEKHMTCKR